MINRSRISKVRANGHRLNVTVWQLREISGLKFFELAYNQKFLIVFTTRLGGVSNGNFKNLNLGYGIGDRKANVDENLSRLKRAFAIERLVKLDQIHSARVFYASGTTTFTGDGLFTDRPDLTLSVKVADCLPIYFFNSTASVAGVAHAGWRGTAAQIATAMVREILEKFKISAGDLHYAFGPCISSCCYKVGTTVYEIFNGKFITKRNGKFYLDLKAANRAILKDLGLTEAGSLDFCTRCHKELFYSARRKNPTGRNLAMIQIKTA